MGQSTSATFPPARPGLPPSNDVEWPRYSNIELMSQPLKFHGVHGENINLDKNNHIAKRVESFCKGICFSNRPVAIGEKIIIRFKEVSTSWSGVLRVGVTNTNPDSLRNTTLPRYACPDLTNKQGNWAKALNERFTYVNNILYFYVSQNGSVMYGVDNQEKGIFFSGVNSALPMWVMADIYGNTIAIEISSEGPVESSSSTAQGIPPQVEDFTIPPAHIEPERPNIYPAIRYHANARFNPLSLSPLCGRNVTLKANKTIACRSTDEYCQGYVFTSRPVGLGEKVVIQILATTLNFYGGLCFGVTTCDPGHLMPEHLPDDADNLLDRSEYWVVNKDVYSDPSVGDELSFLLTQSGEIRYSKNNHHVATLMHVDTTLPLWFFLDIFGNSQKIRVLGVIASLTHLPDTTESRTNLPDQNTYQPNSVFLPQMSDTPSVSNFLKPDVISECVVCYENVVDTVIYTCGHMCMCHECANEVKHTGDALCPICRQKIKDVIRTYRS